jgi:hypothetical protein
MRKSVHIHSAVCSCQSFALLPANVRMEQRLEPIPAPLLARGERLFGYSHSMVPGGLLVISSVTRFTCAISLIMREATRSSRS